MDADPSKPAQSDLLIAHLAWIKRLALELSVDGDRADDLAQETCVVALERPPRDFESLRRWLALVMQNLVRQRRRGDFRRREREERAARGERLESTESLVARASLQRRIVGAVLDLDEPYRSTILLRFFEDLPPRDIARRHHVPTTTVQSRITRGLAKLRAALDDGRGGKGSLFALLVPLTRRSSGPLASLGGVIVNAKVTLSVVSIAVIATVAAVIEFGGTSEPRGGVAHSPDASAPRADEEMPSALEDGTERAPRVELAAAEPSSSSVATAPPAEAAAQNRVRGRVVDATGTALSGVELQFIAGDTKTAVHSGAGGFFELDTTSGNGTIDSNDARFATLCEAVWVAQSSIEPLVIVATAIDVGGSVIDPARLPVPGARVALAMPRGFDTNLGLNLEGTRAKDWSARTDASGRFEMRAMPQVARATLRVLVDGYEPAMEPQPEFSNPNLLFELVRPAVLAQGALRGRVLLASGDPAATARVAVGCASTITDERGEFALDLTHAVTADAVTAVKTGFLPVRMERPHEPTLDDTGWPDFIELRLGSPSLSITARVVDPDGKPRETIGVWLADPTLFGLVGTMPVQNESLMAGATIPAHALEPGTPMKADGTLRRIYTGVGGQPDAVWNYVLTDADGRFVFPGLDDRAYTLRLYDAHAMHVFTTKPIRAGERDVEIVMPGPDVHEKLSGRIVTVGGRPVAGAVIALRAKCFQTQARFFGGTQEVNMLMRGSDATTDAEGRFSLDRVPKEHVYLEIRGDAIESTDWTMPAGVDALNLEIFVDARFRLDVRLSAPVDRADEIAIRDGDGALLLIAHRNAERIRTALSAPLEAGRSGVVSVRSGARKLELRKDGQVIETHELGLAPDEINVIEL